jgi:hypothetical protein
MMERYIDPGVEQTPEYYGTLQAMPNPYFIPAWVVHTFTMSCGAPVWIGHAGNKPPHETYTLSEAEVELMIEHKGDTNTLSRLVRDGLARREQAYNAMQDAKAAWMRAPLDDASTRFLLARFQQLRALYYLDFTSRQKNVFVVGERQTYP